MSDVVASAALAIVAVLFTSLWQSALIVGAVWLALRFIPNLGAATKHAVWFVTLVALVVVPVFTVAYPLRSAHAVAVLVTKNDPATSIAGIPDFRGAAETSDRMALANLDRAPDRRGNVPNTPSEAVVQRRQIAIPFALALSIAFLWSLIAYARLVRLVRDFAKLADIRRAATTWSTAYGTAVLCSDSVTVPCAIGFVHPAVVLPTALEATVGRDAVHAIVIHELAHLRRNDVWTNALARIAEALLSLTPAAWFALRRLAIEREIACDDLVVAQSCSARAFADTLAILATQRPLQLQLGAPTALGSRHALVARIASLLDTHPRRLRTSTPTLGGTVILLILFAFLVQFVSPAFAYAPPSTPKAIVQGLPLSQAASACTEPDHGIQLASYHGRHGEDVPLNDYDLRDYDAMVKRYGAAHVAKMALDVDAMGRARNITLYAPTPYVIVNHVLKSMVSFSHYLPATHDCRHVSTRILTGAHLRSVAPEAFSAVWPEYASGSPTSPACDARMLRSNFPALPASAKKLSPDAQRNVMVRVRVNAAGLVTDTQVYHPSSDLAFDAAVARAARAAPYPLHDAAFFAVRSRSVHGKTVIRAKQIDMVTAYAGCPKPNAYIWSAGVLIDPLVGLPGTTDLPVSE